MKKALQANFNHLQQYIKNHAIRLLNDVYAELGCTKTDVSRWKSNPFSTHASTRSHKIKVILKAMELFHLSPKQAESLANKAGLSLFNESLTPKSQHPLPVHGQAQAGPQSELKMLLKNCGSRNRKQLYHMAVSERMIQYYLAGKEPTKQALLAITIILELSVSGTAKLLQSCGYCLSGSLANDAVVQWFMENNKSASGADLLYSVNETLDILELPLLLTKQINRK